MWFNSFSLVFATAVVAANSIQMARAIDEVHEGKVISVGDSKLTVLDRRDDDNDTFVVTAATKITRNGKPAKLNDIQPGDMASVTATSQDGMLVAKVITAASPM